MPAKKLTPQQQRDRRAKIMLGVLGAVLLLIVAIEAPGMLSGSKSATPPATTGTSTSPVAGASLASAVVATPQASQLRSFSKFATKDPFHPLISTGAASGSSSSSGPTTSPASSSSPPAKTPAGGTGTPSTTPPAAPTVTFAQPPGSTTTTPTGPMVLGVVMKLNGVRHAIAVGSTFPVSNPIFKIAGVGRKAVWVSLLAGSFGNGQQTLKIELGHPVKLVNTTASVSYLLRMVRMTMMPKPAAPPAVTTSTTTSPRTTGATTTAPTPTTTTTSGG